MGCFPVIEVWATALDVSPDHVTIADFQAALSEENQRTSLQICARLHRRAFEQPRSSLAGRNDSVEAGFILGKAAGWLWHPMMAGTAACFLGGTCSFWLGRRLGHNRHALTVCWFYP